MCAFVSFIFIVNIKLLSFLLQLLMFILFKFINFFSVRFSDSSRFHHLLYNYINSTCTHVPYVLNHPKENVHSIFHLSLHLMFRWWILFALALALSFSWNWARFRISYSFHFVKLSFCCAVLRFGFCRCCCCCCCVHQSWSLFRHVIDSSLSKNRIQFFSSFHLVRWIEYKMCALLLDCIMFTL